MPRRSKRDDRDKAQADSKSVSAPGDISGGFLEGLRGMIEIEVQRAIQNLKPSEMIDAKYPPGPQPKLVGKKFLNTERLKLSVMIDKNLYEAIQDCGKETSRSYSDIVNSALWFYFQKPKLSFQEQPHDK
ncbi:MAG: hypothetical protein ACLPVO_15410 [Desulfomonilaceae bacterium]